MSRGRKRRGLGVRVQTLTSCWQKLARPVGLVIITLRPRSNRRVAEESYNAEVGYRNGAEGSRSPASACSASEAEASILGPYENRRPPFSLRHPTDCTHFVLLYLRHAPPPFPVCSLRNPLSCQRYARDTTERPPWIDRDQPESSNSSISISLSGFLGLKKNYF